MNIQNDFLSLSVTLTAAEMTSLIDKKTGKEVLWQGDPAYWSGRNPILFPIVGSTFDKKIHLFGKIFEMGNHGFARNSEFELVSHTEDQITVRLKESEKTLTQYPFHFTLMVRYTLVQNTVHINYSIENNEELPMPFSFGLHPAFALGDPDDALLCFPQEEIHPQTQQSFSSLKMDDAFFSQTPTFILEHPNSESVDLCLPDRTVRVGCEGYRWLAFWKKPEAKFICIEPWHGHGDFKEVTTDFTQREGTINLDPHQSFHTSTFISVF
jgi:galactose mutarotase-like enzyme